MSFKVLFVCASNVCRSPTAVRIFTDELSEDLARHIAVDSAGVTAVPGKPWCTNAQHWLTRHRGQTSLSAEHRSRRLTAAKVERSGLILATDPEVRSLVLRMSPRSRARIFTLVEAADLASAIQQAMPVPDDSRAPRSDLHVELPPRRLGEPRLAWLVTEMDAARGLVPPTSGRGRRSKALDPLDPHGPDTKSHRLPLKLLSESVVSFSRAMARVNES